jgi:fermentation-respiration switch protein FrsA (DUF1100 family)
VRSSASNGVTTLAGLVLAGAVVAAIIWALQRKLIYFPLADVPHPATVGLARAEAVAFPTEDGLTLHGWFVPPTAPASGITAIVFNGNAGHRGFRAPLARLLAECGVGTLLFDYRGYGENDGAPSEAGLAEDARAARSYITTRADVESGRVIYFGESLGSAVAVRLATEREPLALILRSPFTSMVDVGRHHYPLLPVGTLLVDRYPSIDRVASIHCPLLVITAARDSVVPSEQSRRLCEAARQPKRLVVIDGVDHNDFELLAGPRLKSEIDLFLRSLRRLR